MEVRVLRYFLAVAKEESISKAADYLHISQPTLSRQLKDLENELNSKLFIRGSRKITLTENGSFLKNRASEIISLLDKTESEFNNNEILSGEINIGGGETKAFKFIANIIKELQMEYPDVVINLFSGNAEDVLERLDKGLLDFGVLIDPTDTSRYEFIKLPMKDTWGLLVHEDNILNNKNQIRPTNLLGVPLITSRQTFVDNELSSWLNYDIEKLNIVSTYNLIYNASLLVKEKVGSALCLDGIINTKETSLNFIPLYPPLNSNIKIVWKKHQTLSKGAKNLLNRIIDSVNDNK